LTKRQFPIATVHVVAKSIPKFTIFRGGVRSAICGEKVTRVKNGKFDHVPMSRLILKIISYRVHTTE
jgi:hypothetical protein